MKKAIIISLLILAGLFMFLRSSNAITCFLTGEQRSGLYKICYYNCVGSTVAITIKATKLCPLTIER